MDGINLFVAECEVWKGQKKLIEAIDQLLGYLTHRDSKTALIFFVDQKETTSVVNSVKKEVLKRPNLNKYIQDTYEYPVNYEFTIPYDRNKKIQIELMIFHFSKI